MILVLYSIILILLCCIPILIIQYKSDVVIKNSLKNHVIFFLCKLIIISMFIYIFIFNLSISNYKLFIIIGCFIFVVFHFIEGFILQNILTKHGRQ